MRLPRVKTSARALALVLVSACACAPATTPPAQSAPPADAPPAQSPKGESAPPTQKDPPAQPPAAGAQPARWLVGSVERDNAAFVYATVALAPEKELDRMMPLRKEIARRLLVRHGALPADMAP